MARTAWIIVLLVVIYVGGYVGFRQTHAEVWERDKQVYVMFPDGPGRLLYYVWRPLTHVDGALTGMRFHIGPHR